METDLPSRRETSRNCDGTDILNEGAMMTRGVEEFGWFWADVENGAGPSGAMLAPPERPDPVPCKIIRPVFGRPSLPRQESSDGAAVLTFRSAS
jgi:hypothetical protein